MREPLFVLNFLGQGTRSDPSAEYYQEYFLDYKPEKWSSSVSGGAFKFIDENSKHYNLLIAHSADHGISLSYTSGKGVDMNCYVSVADPSRLSEVVDIGVDEFFPVGSFLQPELAWPVVEAFLITPRTPFVSENMKDINETSWPEIKY